MTTRYAPWFLAAALLSLASPAGAATCSDCHGMPPIDAPYRNITTGGFKGSHQTHQPAIATAATCAGCHTGSASYATDHMNGRVDMSSNLNNSPVAALYSKGVFFNQTSNPVMGTCSNVNCHFERTTPVWASGPLAVPGGCSTCHDNPPADGSHPSLSGSGKKHGDYYGTGTTSCIKCHVDHTVEANPFAHASSASKRGLILRFTAAPNTGGTYSKTADLAYPAYLPSQTPAANRNGTCTSMYCHSDGNGGAARTTPTWGGTLPTDCTGCHGGNAASASAISSGVHAQHINAAAVIGTNYDCARCHSGTVSAGNDRAIATLTNHVAGSKTVSFLGGGTYNASTKTCTATTCHSAGKSTAPQPAAPAWTGGALSCNGCHGTSNALGTPDYANGGAGTALANSHAKHVAAAADCDYCHAGTTVTGTAIKSGSALHTNGAIDITFDTASVKVGTGATWTATTKTCTNVYCHGATLAGGGTTKSPVWGTTLSGCGTCHGDPPATTTHAGVTTTQCINCHSHVNATGTGFTNPALHIDGIVEGGDCVSCHSTQQGTGTRQVVGTDTTLASHHIVATTIDQKSCAVCHEQTVFGHKVAGDVAVGMFNQDTGAALTYDGTTATAGNVETSCSSCHDANGASRLGANALKPFADSGDATVPPNIGWAPGAMAHSANMACFNCHGNSAGVAGNTLNPKYNAHGSATAKMLQYAYSATDTMTTAGNFCYNCHGTTIANGVTSPSIQAAVNLSSSIGHKSAKCSDCHDPHTAQPGVHTAGPNAAMAPVLNGVAGKGGWPATSPAMATTWTGTGTLAVTYTTKPAATNEYEICFKCHAGTVPAPTGYTAGALRMTDLGLEFNPNNKSGHPVVASLNNYGGSATPKALLASDMVAPWTVIGTQTMTCSDCHGATGTGAKGPHGSSVRWMLTGTNQAWPFTTTAGNGTASGTPWSLGNLTTGTAPNKLFCLNCHVVNATNGIHDALQSGQHSSWKSTARGACISCHIRIPHGAKTSRLLRLGTAAVLGRYAPDGNGSEVGTSTQQVMSKYTKGTQTSNRRGSFSAVGCSEHSGGTETW
ncbi:cytochrome c [Geotalea uraniireducens]|uniref:Cytochrome c n=1 Tax=Geotalea uraniireducens TaxID=351604 RepID=A0ABN6VZM6_9BACT|nr:CxxxxCH/CxxCH domain-containing protein [Geotalea uraniireducens]BDV44292.1 cytochrome c [Geotalea uraniireducens]